MLHCSWNCQIMLRNVLNWYWAVFALHANGRSVMDWLDHHWHVTKSVTTPICHHSRSLYAHALPRGTHIMPTLCSMPDIAYYAQNYACPIGAAPITVEMDNLCPVKKCWTSVKWSTTVLSLWSSFCSWMDTTVDREIFAIKKFSPVA